MAPKNSKPTITENDFLAVVTQIQNANTLDNLFDNSLNILGIKRFSYHHLVDIGEFHTRERKRYFSHNIPQRLITYYENHYDANKDPGVLKVFSTGQFVWLSDMITDQIVIKMGGVSKVETLISDFGDALLVPLYGPQNRRGYLYLNFGTSKEVLDPYFAWQVQSLAQIAHVKYTLMLLGIKTKIKLTNREIEVLELMTFGKTNPEIGIILNISTNTVSGYVKQIFLKLGTGDRVTTALKARSLSLVF